MYKYNNFTFISEKEDGRKLSSLRYLMLFIVAVPCHLLSLCSNVSVVLESL